MTLERILNAGSVAIIGASRDEKKRGYQAVRALRDSSYEGMIYPVNPREESVNGLRCAASVLDIEGPVDLALVTTPAASLPTILEECGRKAIAGAVIIGGGFGELGAKGRRLQDKIVAVARLHGMCLIGPNTSDLINVHSGLNLVGLNKVPKGDIALVSESGNMALHLITEAGLKSHKGFSYYVGVGNEADVKFHEYLEFLTADEKTRAIVMYVEGMSDGRRFLQQAYRTTPVKPVVLLKSGRSLTGMKSAGSHTGALAGISEVARTAFARAGIVTVDNSDELFPAVETLSGLPPVRKNRMAVLADGGGHATIAADVLTDHGVRLPSLDRPTRERLARVLSTNATLTNPVDVAGSTDSDPGVFADCARILLENESIDGLLALHGAPVSPGRVAGTAAEAIKIADDFGGAVALKVVSPDILHKSDAGGVRLGLDSPAEVERAFEANKAGARRYREQADFRGCLVSPMAESCFWANGDCTNQPTALLTTQNFQYPRKIRVQIGFNF